MQWEQMDFPRQFDDDIDSRIHSEGWTCEAALDWMAPEENAYHEQRERGEVHGDGSSKLFNRCKRDVFYLAGWFARGRRYWRNQGEYLNQEIADVSLSSIIGSLSWAHRFRFW